MTTQKKHVTWKYLDLYVPFIRAYGKAAVPASQGFVLLGGDGTGGYVFTEDKPSLDEEIAGYMVQRCVLEQFVDENGEMVIERLVQNDPLAEGETIGAVFAEDVLLNAADLQDMFGPQGLELIDQMQQAGSSQALVLLVPQGQTAEGNMQMTLNPIALPADTTVEDMPQSVADAIEAEANAADVQDDPNSEDDLFNAFEDNDDDDDKS
jgi:hypothetical protein